MLLLRKLFGLKTVSTPDTATIIPKSESTDIKEVDTITAKFHFADGVEAKTFYSDPRGLDACNASRNLSYFLKNWAKEEFEVFDIRARRSSDIVSIETKSGRAPYPYSF